MSHFAQIDKNGIVKKVLVGDNNDPNGDEGYQWFIHTFGGEWIQTSYNNNFRKQFAGIGYFYDRENDVFIRPQPFASWHLDDNFDWQPPVKMPDQGNWTWNEEEGDWVALS